MAELPKGLPKELWLAIGDFIRHPVLSHVCRHLWRLLQKRHYQLHLRSLRLPQWVEWCRDQVPCPAPDRRG